MLLAFDVVLDKSFTESVTPFQEKVIELLFKGDVPTLKLTKKKFINVNSIESIEMNFDHNLLEITLLSGVKFLIVQTIDELMQFFNSVNRQ